MGEVAGPLGITHGMCADCFPKFIRGVRRITAGDDAIKANNETETTNA